MRIITTADRTPIYTLVWEWDGVPVIIPGMTPGTIPGIMVMAVGMAGEVPGLTVGGTHPGIMAGIAPGLTADGTHPGITVVGTIPGTMVDIGVAAVTITVSMTAIMAV